MYIVALCLLSALNLLPCSVDGFRFEAEDSLPQAARFLNNNNIGSSRTTRNARKSACDKDKPLTSTDIDADDYINSTEYERLSQYFSEIERELDKSTFLYLKNETVQRKEGYDVYIPKSFDLHSITAVPEVFHENFTARREDHWLTLMQLRTLYVEELACEKKLEELSARRSEEAKTFHQLSETDKDSRRENNTRIRNEAKLTESHIKQLKYKISVLLEKLPNIISEDVPLTYQVVEKESQHQANNDKTKIVPHHKVLERLSLPCTLKAIEISGTGFSAFSGDLSRLERALANFMLDTHRRLFNYTELSVPFVVSKATLKRTGHLPRFEEDLFRLDERHQSNGDQAYLIPTAEIPLLALFGNSRLQTSSLPVWVMAYTPCFRSEIQDYGRETRGLIRNHQFGKVELVCLCEPSNSDHFHSLMISHIEYILEALELPYRRVLLPASETGATSSKTVDFEVFFPSLNKYIEISSCSNTRDYQSIRLNLFGRNKSKIHCINGSGLAIGRTLSAILENYQTLDKNSRLEIAVPKVLQPYLDGQEQIKEPVIKC